MKKFNWLFLFLFSFAFVACDDDDDVELDTIDPVVNVTSPTEGAALRAGDQVQVAGNITDNMGLEAVRVFVVGPNGTRITALDREVRDFLNDDTNFNLNETFTLPVEATPGAYIFTVQAQDDAGNIVEQDRNVTVNAAEPDATAFNALFADTQWWETFDANDDTFLDEAEFGASFFEIGDTNDDEAISETEFNDFAANFGLENQNFATFDTNNDGILSQEEFMTGLQTTDSFNNFDQNNDAVVDETEFTDSIFGFWDDDVSGTLSDDELNDRFNTFFGV